MPVAPDRHHGSVSAWRRALLAEQRPSLPLRTLAPEDARGLVLAEPVRAPEDVPAVPVSAMDGFAVRRADLTAPGTTVLPVDVDLPARPGLPDPLAPGRAARIMTGAPVPAGADAIVIVEDTDADPYGACPEQVSIALEAMPAAGRHIRGIGEEIEAGSVLAPAGTRVEAGLIGLARTLGIDTLGVHARARVTVVVTGDELAGAGEDVAPGAVRESNGAMLEAAFASWGAVGRTIRAGDDPEALRTLLADIEDEADLVVTTGGIGRGAFDVVKAALGPRGSGSSVFEHLALRPGGPQGRGHLPGGTPIVHLPGTPVGALVGAHLFLRPLLDPGAAVGLGWRAELLGDPGRSRPGGLVVQPGRLSSTADGHLAVELLDGRRLAPYGQADALILHGALADGEDVDAVRALPL